MLSLIKKVIPKPVFQFFQPLYHYLLSFVGALIYRFPSKNLIVIGITGTKGKTTTTEFVNSIFEASGYKTAIASTLHFKIGESDRRNLFKMTMPGRFFIQKFLREAVDAGCNVAILEMTSEGAKQFRHKFIDLDALIFTNLAPEHIESHGSYENYLNAKLSIAKGLETSNKKNPAIIANADDKEGEKFLNLDIKNKIPYSIKDAFNIKSDQDSSSFQVGKTVIYLKVAGVFNILNALGAIACAKHFGIGDDAIKNGLESIEKIRGRMEKIEEGQNFDIVVDYAHTPDSLKAIYDTYKDHRTICILGNTGGGRDKWKREEMGKIADEYCGEIILTNEDPYDEDPIAIVEDIKKGIKNKKVDIIMDRREAIRTAISRAIEGGAVLITGKGTDPYIMGPNGTKEEWDDATVAREELDRFINHDPGFKVFNS